MRLLVASSDFQTEDFDLGRDPIKAPTEEEHSLDALISSSEMLEHGTTRRIARTTTIRENVGDETARVRLALMHQRRRPGVATNGNEWADADSFKLSSLRADEQIKLDLGPNQTKKLFVALAKRFHELGTLQEVLAELGIRADGEDEFTVRGREREVLARLLEEDQEFWEHLEYLQPDLLTVVALNKQHERRKQALAIFSERLNDRIWSEDDWDRFFRSNQWIFGYGLTYCFLRSIQSQPYYGGTRLSGRGGERGDFLMATEASAKFTVLVEIKLPSAALLAERPYRGNKIYHASKEVSGGVAQLQANCVTWSQEGSRNPATHVELLHEGIHTHEPRGMLVIGNTADFEQDSGKVGSFERYRRNLKNPDIITYDELYARAAHLIDTGFDTPALEVSVINGNGDWDDSEEPPF